MSARTLTNVGEKELVPPILLDLGLEGCGFSCGWFYAEFPQPSQPIHRYSSRGKPMGHLNNQKDMIYYFPSNNSLT